MKNMLKYGLIIVAVLAVLGGAWLGGFISFGKAEDASAAAAPLPPPDPDPIYLAMDPPFVVNFQHRGALHYLQIELQMMYHDQAIIDRIVADMPAVRNDLILLFSNQEFEMLITAEGKEALRGKIVEAVNRIAGVEPDAETGESDGQVYITHFVMQ